MISAPSEMRWKLIPRYHMYAKVTASTSGIDSATTTPLRRPRLKKLTSSTMPTAKANFSRNSLTEWVTVVGWNVALSTSMPLGVDVAQLLDGCVEAFADFDHVLAGGHDHAKAECGLTLEPHAVLGRVHKATRDLRQLGQTHRAVTGGDRNLADCREAVRRAGRPHLNLPVTGVDDAGGADRVLLCDGSTDGLGRDAQLSQTCGVDLDEDALFLRTDQVDLLDARNQQQAVADRVGLVLQFRIGEAFAAQTHRWRCGCHRTRR